MKAANEVLRDLAEKHRGISNVLWTDLDRSRYVRVSTLLLDEAEALEREEDGNDS